MWTKHPELRDKSKAALCNTVQRTNDHLNLKSWLPKKCKKLFDVKNNSGKSESLKKCVKIDKNYLPFISNGSLAQADGSSKLPIVILRDTGASQTLVLAGAMSGLNGTETNESVLVKGLESEYRNVPLHRVMLESNIVNDIVLVGVTPTLPTDGITILPGNDIAGGVVTQNPCYMTSAPIKGSNNECNILRNNIQDEFSQVEYGDREKLILTDNNYCSDKIVVDIWSTVPEILHECINTRAMLWAKKINENQVDLSQTFISHDGFSDLAASEPTTQDKVTLETGIKEFEVMPSKRISRENLILEKNNDSDISKLKARALSEYESECESI